MPLLSADYCSREMRSKRAQESSRTALMEQLDRARFEPAHDTHGVRTTGAFLNHV